LFFQIDVLLPGMKKYSLLLLSFFYFICATGLYVHAHYCGGALDSVNYSALIDFNDCGCGDEQSEDDCCKDITHFYKVDSHQSYHSVNANEAYTFQVIHFISNFKIFEIASLCADIFKSHAHAPPPFLFSKASKLIVNCIFRI
jgi:hypothetical protein